MSTPAPMTAPTARDAERLPPLRFGFLATGPWILGFVVCILFAFLCHALAQWQWDRRVEVQHRVNRVLENYDDDPVPFAEASRLFTAFQTEDEWTPVTLTGEYLVDETLIVRNRPRAGQPGYEVLVPFRTDEGPVVVVDRGWLPVGNTPGQPDAVPAPPAGHAEVVVRVKPGEPALDRDAPDGQVPSIDLAEIAGVSVRRLQQAFREHLGTTPFAHLHDLRLDRIHDDLVHGRGGTVTEVALSWGITHLGRFAAAYRERFGELPSQTLARAA